MFWKLWGEKFHIILSAVISTPLWMFIEWVSDEWDVGWKSPNDVQYVQAGASINEINFNQRVFIPLQ